MVRVQVAQHLRGIDGKGVVHAAPPALVVVFAVGKAAFLVGVLEEVCDDLPQVAERDGQPEQQ